MVWFHSIRGFLYFCVLLSFVRDYSSSVLGHSFWAYSTRMGLCPLCMNRSWLMMSIHLMGQVSTILNMMIETRGGPRSESDKPSDIC